MPGLARIERSQHARPYAEQRIELLDGRVGAVHEQCAAPCERSVGVRALGHAGPEAVGDVAVRRTMRELHGGGYPELSEARKVFVRQELRVLDALPQAPWSPLVLRALEAVERFAVGEVADRVHCDGKAEAGCARDDVR